MTPERQQQLQQDFAKMRHYWEVQSRDISPTRREWNAPYMAAWMRIEEAFADQRETIEALRCAAVAEPERV